MNTSQCPVQLQLPLVGAVGWVWLWPYHFKGACSGPASPVKSDCLLSPKGGGGGGGGGHSSLPIFWISESKSS